MKHEPLSILFPWQSEVTYRELPESAWHDLGMDVIAGKVAAQPQEIPLIRRVMTSMTADPRVTAFRCDVFADILSHDSGIVSKLSLTAFTSVFPTKELLDFNDVFGMYVVDHLMKLSGIYLEDAKQVLRLLCKYLKTEASKDYQLLLLRKMGVPMTMLVSGEDEILLEDNTEIIACANLMEFEEALKDQLIA